MPTTFSNCCNSTSLKAAVIGLLVLLLLIPVAMIHGVIEERSATSDHARQEIMRAWGHQQIIGGPILVLPYELVRSNRHGERESSKGNVYLLPADLTIEAELTPEMRYRGLHKVPVYTAHNRIAGAFAEPDISGLGIDDATVDWGRAYIALSITDARPVRSTPDLVVNEKRLRFASGGSQVPGLAPQITAPLGGLLADSIGKTPLDFSIGLDIGGTDRLQFLPFGDVTHVSVRAAWPSPSFIGSYLPETREVGEQDFSASWRVSSLGRAYASRWVSGEEGVASAERSAFGVDLFVPVGLYQLTTRATKYAILFIGLTFVAYFMFEIIAGLRLHALQYLLVGFANTLFFLLLLSLAEHIGFAAAYLMSAIASAGLIAGYSVAVLHTGRRALTMLLILGVLYVFLYLVLRAENYALLAGSIGLWVALSLIMYLTRGIDWSEPVHDGTG